MKCDAPSEEQAGPGGPSTSTEVHPVVGQVNVMKLALRALEIVVSDLTGYGNTVSEWHRASLLELLQTFASYCSGSETGRHTFGLPTGMGKTSAIAAFVTALHELGYEVPVAIAASRVQAITDLKQKLIAHGIPEEWIGIKHESWDAEEPSTGNDSRLIQLVTHARVRSGADFNLYGEHKGRPRPLMIWDESLLRSNAKVFPLTALRQGEATLSIELEGKTDAVSLGLHQRIRDTVQAVQNRCAELDLQGDPEKTGLPLTLQPLEQPVLEAYTSALRRTARTLKDRAQLLSDFIEAAQGPMQAIKVEQGAGAVAISEAIPPKLRNIVILDASTAVRKIVHADRSVRPVENFRPEHQKNFSQVRIHQILSGGGRSTIEAYFKGGEASPVSMEVIDIVREHIATARAFLIFTFKKARIDLVDALGRDMTRAGINLRETTTEGKARFEFLTWGNHEGINGFEHCDIVIMVGTIHRGHLDLAGTLKAQLHDLSAPTPSERLHELAESEVAHAIYQGASRGSCRRVNNGLAGAMDLYIIHRSKELAQTLAPVMPNAIWSYREPKHIRRAHEDAKTQVMLEQVVVFLHSLPDHVHKVSTTEAKKQMGLTGSTKAETMLFTRACRLLHIDEHGWEHEGRSFVRAASDALSGHA